MIDFPSGETFRSYNASDTFSTVADIAFLDRDGVARLIATGERVIIGDIVINNGATASIYTIFQDANGDGLVTAGDQLFRVALPIDGQAVVNFAACLNARPKVSTVANGIIKVIASAGSVGSTVILAGIITKS